MGGGARKGFRPFGGWGVRVRICGLVGLVAAVQRMTPVLWSPVPVPCRAPGGVGAAGLCSCSWHLCVKQGDQTQAGGGRVEGGWPETSEAGGRPL